MRDHLDAEPYTKFWFDCAVNNTLSILTSKDRSYEQFALCNFYQYQPIGSPWALLATGPMPSPLYMQYAYLLKRMEPHHFNRQDYLDEIKELIRQRRYINITVDGYYWIPNNFNWEINHLPHKSLISGYDDEKKLLYAFEDDFSGYKEFAIPYDRLHTAMISNDSYEYFEYVLPAQLPSFELKPAELAENARMIIRSIGVLSFQDFFYAGGEINPTYFASWLKRTESRYRANAALFALMQREGMLSTEAGEALSADAAGLISGWSKFKTLFMIAMRKNSLDFSQINALAYRSFSAERAMWLRFLRCIGEAGCEV